MTTFPRIGVLAAVGSAFLVSACGTGGLSPSGFLSNYGQLGGGYSTANAVAGYLKPNIDPAKYESIMIDQVTTIVSADGVPAKAVEQLAAYSTESLTAELGKVLRIVSTPGPTTARLRVAITDVVEGMDAAAAVRTVQASPKATLKGALGSQVVADFVSKAGYEGEIVDSQTGERLLASSDQRLGAKREITPSTDWIAVKNIAREAAVNTRRRLEEMAPR